MPSGGASTALLASTASTSPYTQFRGIALGLQEVHWAIPVVFTGFSVTFFLLQRPTRRLELRRHPRRQFGPRAPRLRRRQTRPSPLLRRKPQRVLISLLRRLSARRKCSLPLEAKAQHIAKRPLPVGPNPLPAQR